MSCSGSPSEKYAPLKNIKTCEDCTSSPTHFFCVGDGKCYCNNIAMRNMCTQMLQWGSGKGLTPYFKPCVVSPSVAPLVCPPSYISPTPEGGSECNLPSPPSVKPADGEKWSQYMEDVKTYARQPPIKLDGDNKSMPPINISPSDALDYVNTYGSSPYCYDCKSCQGPETGKAQFVPPLSCQNATCVPYKDGYVMRCMKFDGDDDVCDISSSHYCLNKQYVWDKTDPRNCLMYNNSPKKGQSYINCLRQIPAKLRPIPPISATEVPDAIIPPIYHPTVTCMRKQKAPSSTNMYITIGVIVGIWILVIVYYYKKKYY